MNLNFMRPAPSVASTAGACVHFLISFDKNYIYSNRFPRTCQEKYQLNHNYKNSVIFFLQERTESHE